MRVLIIEDQLKTRSYLEKGLTAAGYTVDAFLSANEALDAVTFVDYEAMLVDVGLPGLSGWDFVRQVRSEGFSKVIIFLTAFASPSEKVQGFDAGADDYLTKPFSMDELLARLRVRMRKSNVRTQADENCLSYLDLKLDLIKRSAKRNDIILDLSVKEFALLEYFLRNIERPLSREQIAENVWNIDFDRGSNVIDVYINHLRKKMESFNAPRLIHTVSGVGYVLKKK